MKPAGNRTTPPGSVLCPRPTARLQLPPAEASESPRSRLRPFPHSSTPAPHSSTPAPQLSRDGGVVALPSKGPHRCLALHRSRHRCSSRSSRQGGAWSGRGQHRWRRGRSRDRSHPQGPAGACDGDGPGGGRRGGGGGDGGLAAAAEAAAGAQLEAGGAGQGHHRLAGRGQCQQVCGAGRAGRGGGALGWRQVVRDRATIVSRAVANVSRWAWDVSVMQQLLLRAASVYFYEMFEVFPPSGRIRPPVSVFCPSPEL